MLPHLLHLLGDTSSATVHLGHIIREAILQARTAVAAKDFQDVTEVLSLCSHSLQANPLLLSTEEVTGVVQDLCFPVTSAVSFDGNRGDKQADAVGAYKAACEMLASLLGNSLKTHHPGPCELVARACRNSLARYRQEFHLKDKPFSDSEEENTDPENAALSLSAALTIIELYLKKSSDFLKGESPSELVDKTWWQEITEISLDILECAEPKICVQLAQILVPKQEVLFISKETKQEMLHIIWARILKMFANARKYSEVVHENIYLIMCALSDPLLPSSHMQDVVQNASSCETKRVNSANILESHEFWDLIQQGLVHANPLTRKRCGYLMKRAVDLAARQEVAVGGDWKTPADQPLFSWNPSHKDLLLKLWLEFFLIYEALDEVQIHVVTPVLPRLAHMTKATYRLEHTGCPMLHSSWLCVLYQRTFVHESKTVTRLGVADCLSLDLAQSSFLQQQGIKFILGPLLTTLHEEYLYTKPADIAPNTQPPIGLALKKFLPSCASLLPDEKKSSFLTDLLALICEQSWGPVTILFVAEALASIPACPVWNLSALFLLRDKLSSGFLTCPSGYRGGVQCFLLRAGFHLLDWTSISLHQVSCLFEVCNAAGVLKRGSPLWHEACEVLPESMVNQPSASGDDPSHATTWTLCIQEVKDYLRVDPSLELGGVGGVPDAQEAQKVGVTMLLVADAAYSWQEGVGSSQPVSELLQPLTGVLSRVGSHIYLPPSQADKALQLLLVLLQESHLHGNHQAGADLMSPLTTMLCHTLDEIFQYLQRWLLGNHESQTNDVRRVALFRSLLHALVEFSARQTNGQSGSPASQSMASRLAVGRLLLLEGCKTLLKAEGKMELSASQGRHKSYVLTSLLAWLLASDSSLPALPLPSTAELFSALLAIEGAVGNWKDDTEGEDTGLVAKRPQGFDRGRFQADLIKTKWEAILSLIRRCDQQEPSGTREDVVTMAMWESLLSACVADVGLVSPPQAVPLLKAAAVLIEKVAGENIPLCLEGVSASWCSVLDGWRSNMTFWCVYEAFIAAAYQPALLQYSEGTEVYQTLQKFTGKIMDQAETRLGMLNSLIHHIGKMLSVRFFQLPPERHKYDAMTVVRNLSGILREGALYGPVTSKSVRLMEDINPYLATHPELSSVTSVLLANMNATNPRLPRVMVIQILMQIGASNFPGTAEFFEEFLKDLFEKDREITPPRRSYIINSVVHRLKLRIWQAAIVVIHFISQASAGMVLEGVLRSMRAENQTSTRHLMEVFIVRLIHLHPHLLDSFWDYVAQVANNQEVSFSPLLMIIAHLGIVQPKDQEESFYLRAIPTVLPWTFVPAMALRTQAQVSLFKMWRDCQEAGLTNVIDRFPGVAVCMDFTQNNSALHMLRQRMEGSFFLRLFHPLDDFSLETLMHTMPYLTLVTPTSCALHMLRQRMEGSFFLRLFHPLDDFSLETLMHTMPYLTLVTPTSCALHMLRQRMEGSFFLRLFHPLDDFSLETLMHTMPYLTLVTPDELVEPELFLVWDTSPWNRSKEGVIPIYNSRDTLRMCQLKEKKKNTSVKDAEIQDSWIDAGAGDVQKKITPWRESHIPGFEPSAGQRSSDSHLVVVASLVDRIPNLGGLCRTCEIFGASCLVLGNLAYKDHQDFLSLSVSAERWLPIREVKPADLRAYMLEMKSHGYSLVGVEQTANSQPLTDFKFPQRTMLLLGKEREGIPVELIQLLDVCVEIPQLGFIRSLNVHVSGALMIWEYTKQKLLKL